MNKNALTLAVATLLVVGSLMMTPTTAASGGFPPDVDANNCFNGGVTVTVNGNDVVTCLGSELHNSGVEGCGDGGYEIIIDGRSPFACIGG